MARKKPKKKAKKTKGAARKRQPKARRAGGKRGKKAMAVKKERIAPGSPDLQAERLAMLKGIVPEAFSEGKVDPTKLRGALGDAVDDRPERYSFTWVGKRDAIRMLQVPGRGRLVPAKKESVNFGETNNVFIEGENLEVLKLLYKAYAGRVKMIYIDPPYNTGNDLIYADNLADPLGSYLELTAQQDPKGNLLTSNPETSGRFHSSWLSMIYPRLFVARQLLREDGVVFVSIDDHEVCNLRRVMNEVFGEENFVAELIWKKMDSPSRNDADRAVSAFHDYVLLFARNRTAAKLRQKAKPEILKAYPTTLEDGRLARFRQLRKNGKAARREDRPSMWYELIAPDGAEVWPIAPEGWEGRWVLSKDTWEERTKAGLTRWVKRDYGWVPYYVEIAPEEPSVPWPTLWTDVSQNRQAKAQFTELMGSSVDFDNPKPCDLIMDMLRMAAEPDDIVLDFFAGSCSTAEAVLRLNNEDNSNRRFIMVQLPEPTPDRTYRTIADIGKERVRRAAQRLREEANGKLDMGDRDEPEDLGFRVFTLTESQFRRWTGTEDKDGENLAEQMDLYVDPLLPGWKPLDVIWEVALQEGYFLSSRIEKLKKPADNTVYRVTDDDKGQSFLVCLDDKLKKRSVSALGLGKDDVFICRDVALDDELAANLALQCRLKVI